MTEYRQRLPYAERPKPKNPIPTAANRKMDNEVLTELYEKYSAKVYNTANCIVKDEEAANDIMQEVFITVWQKYETLREKNKVGAWITTITVNKCREYLRKEKREAAAFSDVFDDDDSSFEETIADEDRSTVPDEAVMDKQIRETLSALISELPEKQRICMLMYYGYDRKISDIAETLGISESTVKSCLNYGKKKLAAKVTELEKKGYILRGTTVAVLPFLIRYLLEEEPSKKIPVSFILRSAKAAAKTGAVIAEGAAAEGAAGAAGASGAAATESAAAGSAAGAASAAGTAAGGAASASTAAAGGVKAAGKAAAAFIKLQAKSVAFKVVSGVAAAAVLVGGGAAVGSTITEKRMTENPPTAAVGELLTDNGKPISADTEITSDISESAGESTTGTGETTTQEAKDVLSRLFGEKETENTSQTSGAMTTKPNSRSAQTTAAESSRNSQTEARQSESGKTTAQNQKQTTKPHTTEPKTTESHTTEPHTTEPHTTEPHTTEPKTTQAPSTTEDEETTGRGINGTKNGALDDDDIWM